MTSDNESTSNYVCKCATNIKYNMRTKYTIMLVLKYVNRWKTQENVHLN